MITQMDLRYSSFENYMSRIEYEEELSKEISALILEAVDMIKIQKLRYDNMTEQLNFTSEKVSN